MKKLLFSGLFAGSFIFCSGQEKQNFSVEDIFRKGTFAARGAAGLNVMNDGLNYAVMLPEGADGWRIAKIDLETGKDTQTLISSAGLDFKINPESWEFSENEKYLILTEKTERIYRHSTRAYAYALDVQAKKLIRIGNEKVMYPTLSADNKTVAFVRDNNLFTYDLASGKESAVTTDGKKNSIINGAVDWVYEEEFSMSRGFEWSPDGTSLAFYKFDESAVKEFSMTLYSGLYPGSETWKYPKAGEDNSKVDVYIYSLITGEKTRCNFEAGDQYFPRIKWTYMPGILSVQHLNRLQNKWTLYFAFASDGHVIPVTSQEDKNYIEINDDLTFLKNKKCFIYTSDKSGFQHIYLFDFTHVLGKSKPKPEVQITNGRWDVLSIAGVDEAAEIIYYNSAEISATEDHFYSIRFNKKNKLNLTPAAGNHMVTLGKGYKYFTDISSSLQTPYHFSLRKTGPDPKNKKNPINPWVRVLEDNHLLSAKLNDYHFPQASFDKMVVRNGDTLNYYMLKPWNFDPAKKYPVLMFVYGGPGANMVRKNWGGRNYLWHSHLTQQGYIVVSVDNRGTGHRGAAFRKSTYRQLGKLELEDQADAAKWLATKTYVDAGRIGIWGWSFGGYMSSNCIAKKGDIFKAAIAVAPVTNWRYYDNIYTERYMGLPKDNAEGYDQNSPINFVSGIKGNYLIIHGTGDDNVHFQNSVEMVNAMIKAGVNYDSEYYPNRNHGIGDPAAQYHLYRRMTGFILEKL